jgi:hypothetical protein
VAVKRVGERWRSILSAVVTVVVLIVALIVIRGGVTTTSQDARRWTFVEGEAPEAIGLTIEAPRAGAWSLVHHDHATGARALVSGVGAADARAGLAMAADSFSRDVVASTRCRTAPAHRERVCGVVVRHAAPGTYYVARADEGRAVVEIVRYHEGAERVLATTPVRPHEGWREIVFEARGSRLRVTADGVHALEVTDGGITAGGVGLWAAAECEAYFDELTLRRLGSGATEVLPIFQLGS